MELLVNKYSRIAPFFSLIGVSRCRQRVTREDDPGESRSQMWSIETTVLAEVVWLRQAVGFSRLIYIGSRKAPEFRTSAELQSRCREDVYRRSSHRI
jgi:hypothetical protein